MDASGYWIARFTNPWFTRASVSPTDFCEANMASIPTACIVTSVSLDDEVGVFHSD